MGITLPGKTFNIRVELYARSIRVYIANLALELAEVNMFKVNQR